jgi:hypothetical protein
MRPAMCSVLYTAARITVAIVTDRLSNSIAANASSRNEEEIFRCELLAEVLLLLSLLGTKE